MASYSHSSESPGMVQGAYNTTSTMNGAYSLQSLCFLTSQVSTDHGSIRALFSPPAVALLTTVAAIDIILNINHITMAVIISQHYRLCIFPEVFSSPSFCGWVASEEDRRRRFNLFVIAQVQVVRQRNALSPAFDPVERRAAASGLGVLLRDTLTQKQPGFDPTTLL